MAAGPARADAGDLSAEALRAHLLDSIFAWRSAADGALAAMRRIGHGRIIAIAPPERRSAADAAVSGALAAWFDTLRLETGDFDVRTTRVHVGAVPVDPDVAAACVARLSIDPRPPAVLRLRRGGRTG